MFQAVPGVWACGVFIAHTRQIHVIPFQTFRRVHREDLHRVTPRFLFGGGQPAFVVLGLFQPREKTQQIANTVGREHKPPGGGGVLIDLGSVCASIEHRVDAR